jgi:hypothetical protein
MVLRLLCRVVRSIFAFPQWDMLVVATSSSGIRNLGKLRVMHMPSPVDLEQAENKRRQATAAPHRNAQPTVDLKVYVHEAHKQKILATAHLVGASSKGNALHLHCCNAEHARRHSNTACTFSQAPPAQLHVALPVQAAEGSQARR